MIVPRQAFLCSALALVASMGQGDGMASWSEGSVGSLVVTAGEPDPSAADATLAGRYVYAGGEQQRQQLLDAIEDVIAEMNFIARPIARRRLRESNWPSDELHLLITEVEITVARPGRPTVSAPRDGSTITWRSPDGDAFEVRHRLVAADQLIQEFVGEGNRSENVFSLEENGSRMTVQTTIYADRLPKVLRFRMSYRRKPPPK